MTANDRDHNRLATLSTSYQPTGDHSMTTSQWIVPVPSGWTLQELRDCLDKVTQALSEVNNRSHNWYLLRQQQCNLEHLINLIETAE